MQDYEPTLSTMRKLGTWRFNFVFQCYVCPGDKCALHTNEDCWKRNFNGVVLDQHNKLQSHHGLLKLHLVSKLKIRQRKTKSLSVWKFKCYRTSEKLTIRWGTVTKALQIIKHMFYFTTFSQRKIGRFETNYYYCLASFRTIKRLLVNGLDSSVIVSLNNDKNETRM